MAAHIVATLLGLVLVGGGARGMDEEMAELAKMVRESCTEETGVATELLTQVDAGAELASVADATLKCYLKCTMETAGMFSDGEVDVEAVLALLPDELRIKNEESLRACGTRQGPDDCETAFLTQLCWQAANKADYFII